MTELARVSSEKRTKPRNSCKPSACSVTAGGLFSMFPSPRREEAPATPTNQNRLWPGAMGFQIFKLWTLCTVFAFEP